MGDCGEGTLGEEKSMSFVVEGAGVERAVVGTVRTGA